ncbi:acetyltransferase AlgX (SGNH hydrolase-like protein) [Prauserella shujinwangii]|uniref:Acetyltransferase AlgX (SGNH hydrolase-like protein) n=1 Tax=Prauserella shujinwangii TaxID=1453103 RepID=A0A2T0M1P7_9PSEU|nr:hypothetical protein [Prauserella shujinwangii]PRX50491.1 acetyltransferase AlgX (SGNH hydrolase-like protein) [Prauserella shujinwangii]
MTDQPTQLPSVHEAWLPREHPLHRPRHGGRQLLALISALVFFATPTLLWTVGVRPGKIENHELAGFPSVGDGWGFFTGMPQWATDQLAFRPGAIQAADAISRGLFGEPPPFDQGSSPRTGPLPGTGPAPDQRAEAPSTNESGYRRVIEGENGWLYYGYDNYAKCSPQRPLAETLTGINELRRAVEASGRRFVFVVAPDKTTMVPEHLPADYPDRDCARAATAEFWRLVPGQAGAIDLRQQLVDGARRLGTAMYPAQDTHWTDAGSVVLTRALAEAVRPGITWSWRTEPLGEYSNPADLPPMIGRGGEKTSMRFALRPDGETDRTSPPPDKLTTPQRRVAPPLESTVNEPTLVFGDSFTLASSRYLPAGFSDLTMLAYPSMGDNPDATIAAFVKSDVIVLEVVERSVAAGNLPFLEGDFIDQVGRALAERPVR